MDLGLYIVCSRPGTVCQNFQLFDAPRSVVGGASGDQSVRGSRDGAFIPCSTWTMSVLMHIAVAIIAVSILLYTI